MMMMMMMTIHTTTGLRSFAF